MTNSLWHSLASIFFDWQPKQRTVLKRNPD